MFSLVPSGSLYDVAFSAARLSKLRNISEHLLSKMAK